jgi:phage tail protein X
MKTVQGDTWDTIALRAYGSTAHMDKLIMANPGARLMAIFPAGIEITVPEIDTTQAAETQPPWKRSVKHG